MAYKTLVIGASENPERYSYKAVQMLRAHEHDVIAFGRKEGIIADMVITKQLPQKGIETVTLYINAEAQKEYYDYLIALHPKRIIFNPGTENEELYDLLKANDIKPLEACTLVMLSTGQY
jgi:predicted CoA-binding protein